MTGDDSMQSKAQILSQFCPLQTETGDQSVLSKYEQMASRLRQAVELQQARVSSHAILIRAPHVYEAVHQASIFVYVRNA